MDESDIDELTEYIVSINNIDKKIYNEYIQCLTHFNKFVDYINDHPKEMLPGFLTINKILYYIEKNNNRKLFDIDYISSYGKECQKFYNSPDGILTENSLIESFGVNGSVPYYYKIYDEALVLKTKLDLFSYLNTTCLKTHLFSFNIEIDIKEFCNRCTEENYFFLLNKILPLFKYNEGIFTQKELRIKITKLNSEFTKKRKGFIYLLWPSNFVKKSNIPELNKY